MNPEDDLQQEQEHEHERELELFLRAADSLEELKNQLLRQKGAADRISAVSAALDVVANEIRQLPQALRTIADRAAQTEARLTDAGDRFNDLCGSVPALVERIESSDYARQVGRAIEELAEARGELARVRAGADATHASAERVASVTAKLAADFSASLQQLVAQQTAVAQGLGSSNAFISARFSELTTTVAELGAKLDQSGKAAVAAYDQIAKVVRSGSSLQQQRDAELAALQKSVAEMRAQLESQSKMLADLTSRKRGFFS